MTWSTFHLLGNSQFSGTVPTIIGKCKNLDVSLSGIVPTEMIAWPTLAGVVEITNAGLSGAVPIFAFNNMDYISLSKNRLSERLEGVFAQTPTSLFAFSFERNLLEGQIPDTIIGNYTLLTGIFLSNNYITGTIPELGRLAALKFLRLSGNQPTALGQLSAVIELYISEKHLEGPLPGELGRMSALQKLACSGIN
jgi:Leucine-rich repeat (LRR) protein